MQQILSTKSFDLFHSHKLSSIDYELSKPIIVNNVDISFMQNFSSINDETNEFILNTNLVNIKNHQ